MKQTFVLVALGTHGDVHPFIGYGRELRRRGHEVVVVANEHFGDLIRAAGLEHSQIGTEADHHALSSHPDVWNPARSFHLVFGEFVLPALPALVERLLELVEPERTTLVTGALVVAGRIVHELTGVKHVTIALSPLTLDGTEPGARAARRATMDDVVTAPLNAHRRALGLPPIDDFLAWYLSPDCVLAAFPRWYHPEDSAWLQQAVFTEFPLYDESDVRVFSPELDAFLEAGSPPIAFFPGSGMYRGERFFDAAAAACKALGRRGILLTRHREQVPSSLPSGVIHVDYAPFSQLLGRCAALVHHGGIGTTAQALAAALPQVVMPMAIDQPDNAARLERLGVGRTVSPEQFTPDNLAAALCDLLGADDLSARAAGIAGRMRARDGVRRAVDVIERAAGGCASSRLPLGCVNADKARREAG